MKSPVLRIVCPVLFMAGSVAMHAAQFGGITYEASGTEITITDYTGTEGDIRIPDSIEGLPVTGILDRAFSQCTSLTSVVIPDSVTRIGAVAFWGCSDLTSVTIGDSVTSIGGEAFSGCAKLAGVYFEGDAPELVGWVGFGACPAVIIHYREGTAGWQETFDGRPTALWIEPPLYREWLASTGLVTQYPEASGEADDPDGAGMSNYAEMLAGTDPVEPSSVLTLELTPRQGDLTEEDQTEIGEGQHALYFQSVPGKSYGVQWANLVDGPWNTTAVVTATTTQKRLVFDQPHTTDWWGKYQQVLRAFYRVILAQ